MSNDIPTVALCYSIRNCEIFLQVFCKEYENKIYKVFKQYPIKIRLIDGTDFYIMTYKSYERWCKGRTYKFYKSNRIYHSDYLIKEGDSDENTND